MKADSGKYVELNPYPVFSYLPPGWLPLLFTNNMEPHWAAMPVREKRVAGPGAGGAEVEMDLSGMNFFFMPAPLGDDSFSGRFRPGQGYFQVWLGLYILPPGPATSPATVDPLFAARLGARDNDGWNRFMGVANPVSRIVESTLSVRADTSLRPGLECTEIRGTLEVNTDLGDANPKRFPFPWLFAAPAAVWRSELESYAVMRQHCVSYVFFSNGYYIQIYCATAEYRDRDGCDRRLAEEFPEVAREMRDVAASIRIVDDGRGFRAPAPRQMVVLSAEDAAAARPGKGTWY